MNRRSFLGALMTAAVVGVSGWCPRFGEEPQRELTIQEEFSNMLVGRLDRVFEADITSHGELYKSWTRRYEWTYEEGAEDLVHIP